MNRFKLKSQINTLYLYNSLKILNKQKNILKKEICLNEITEYTKKIRNINEEYKILIENYQKIKIDKKKSNNIVKSTIIIKDNLCKTFTENWIITNEFKEDLTFLKKLISETNEICKKFNNKSIKPYKSIDIQLLEKYFKKLILYTKFKKNNKKNKNNNDNNNTKIRNISVKFKHNKHLTNLKLNLKLPKNNIAKIKKNTRIVNIPEFNSDNKNIKNPLFTNNLEIINKNHKVIDSKFVKFRNSLNVENYQKEKIVNNIIKNKIILKSYWIKLKKPKNLVVSDFNKKNTDNFYIINKLQVCYTNNKEIHGLKFSYLNMETNKVKIGKIHGIFNKEFDFIEYDFNWDNRVIEINFNYNSYLYSIIITTLKEEFIIIGDINKDYDIETHSWNFIFKNNNKILDFTSIINKDNKIIKNKFKLI